MIFQLSLDSVDQKLIEFFPEYITDELNPRKKEINLKHLLTMSAGFKWNDWGPDIGNWYSSPDWSKFTIQLPLENNPGDVFNYNTSISHLLSIILSKSTKTSTLDFAKQNLFEPIGIQSAYWHQGPQGYNIGGFGLGLSAQDLAKIGFLFLNNGYWNGQSIVPEYWVKESTRQWMDVGKRMYGPIGYGYQWWIKEVDGCFSYRAWGRRGQFIVVVPELDMVIVVTSETADAPFPTSIHYSPLFDLVASAVKRERPMEMVWKPNSKIASHRIRQMQISNKVGNISVFKKFVISSLPRLRTRVVLYWCNSAFDSPQNRVILESRPTWNTGIKVSQNRRGINSIKLIILRKEL